MATVDRSRVSLTRRINRIFRARRHAELAAFGLYTPEPIVRLPSDAPPPSEPSTDLGDVPFKTILVPRLDENGQPMLDKNGEPMMRSKKVPLTDEELEANKDAIEAERKRKEEEERLRREEEERQAKLAAMREENLQTLRDVTGGKDTADAAQAAQVARKMGFAPTANEILAMEAKYGAEVDYDQLLEFMTTEVVMEPQEELLSFFKHYDRSGDNHLSKAQIKTILTAYGEPLSSEEFDALMEVCGCQGDPVNYVEFVQQLLTTD